jgi:hypothetical protein
VSKEDHLVNEIFEKDVAVDGPVVGSLERGSGGQ